MTPDDLESDDLENHDLGNDDLESDDLLIFAFTFNHQIVNDPIRVFRA